MALSDKLYTLRKKNGLSQEQLAQQLNVSRQAISKWESGAAMPETEKLLLISDYFKVSLDHLMKDEETAPLSTAPEIASNRKDDPKNLLGILLSVGGILCLILWGLLSIFLPSVSDQLRQSSMIQIDGNGIFMILCVGAVIMGAILLLKRPGK